MFVLNPKCASTSITSALEKLGRFEGQRHTPLSSSPDKSIVACVVRNDEDRLRSAWNKSTPSFETWKNKEEGDEWIAYGDVDIRDVPQHHWFNYVNMFLQFENLQEDWERFCKEVGISTSLKHLNKGLN